MSVASPPSDTWFRAAPSYVAVALGTLILLLGSVYATILLLPEVVWLAAAGAVVAAGSSAQVVLGLLGIKVAPSRQRPHRQRIRDVAVAFLVAGTAGVVLSLAGWVPATGPSEPSSHLLLSGIILIPAAAVLTTSVATTLGRGSGLAAACIPGAVVVLVLGTHLRGSSAALAVVATLLAGGAALLWGLQSGRQPRRLDVWVLLVLLGNTVAAALSAAAPGHAVVVAAVVPALSVVGAALFLTDASLQLQRAHRRLQGRERDLRFVNAAISHDIEQAGTAASVALQAAQAHTLSAGCSSALNVAERAHALLRARLHTLAAFTRAESGDVALEPVELSELVQTAAGEARAVFGDVEFAQDGGATVEGDRELLLLLVANLTGNAFRHGGSRCRVDIVPLDRDRVRLTVSDDGPGPTPRMAAALHDGLRRDGARDTQGLGIATAQAIAQLHGGTLLLCPSEIGGSAVTFAMPLRQP